MPAMYGFTSSGASVWPRKTLALAESDSAPETPISFCITTAIALTTHCMTPR